jgi:hypothetical protein
VPNLQDDISRPEVRGVGKGKENFMLLEIKPEYRAILAKSPNVVVDIPRSTPAHIRARLVASSIALCEKRSITPFEERCYQADATRFQASRPRPVTAVKKQIAAKPPVVPTIDRRHGELALRYSALSYDQIKRAVRLNYDVDTLNALNLAELRKQIRYQDGSASDPELKFRDDEGTIWPEAARTTAEHEESAEYHANCASKAKSLHDAEAHYHASDRHKQAAEHPNDTLASDRARQASKIIGHPENSL